MDKKIKLKECEYCQNSVKIRYRIRYDTSKKWVKVCPNCWDSLSKNNPFYVYGGTWKAKR
jgi:hypothetical protein